MLCEIRSIKGVPTFVPDGTAYLLRAEVEGLPESFKRLRARVRLSATARQVVAAEREPDGVRPDAGWLEEAVGVVGERQGGVVVVDVGFPLEVRLPAGMTPPRLGERVRCQLAGKLVASDLELL